MLYYKIRVSSTDAPKRFYRIMYVRKDLYLSQLGYVVLIALGAEFEHMYMFRDKSNNYVDSSWLEDNFGFDCLPKDLDYEEYCIDDLELKADRAFRICYDTGDDWEFNIKVYKKEVDLPEDYWGTVIEGKGDRIWEDNHYLFWQYLEKGSDALTDDEARPWNVYEDDNLDSFDDSIDIDLLNGDVEYADEFYETMQDLKKDFGF